MSATVQSTYKTLCILSDNLHQTSKGLKKRRQNLQFKVWSIVRIKKIQQLLTAFETETLNQVLEAHPKIVKKPFKSYICSKWNTQRRIQSIHQHFQFLEQEFGHNLPLIFTDKGHLLLVITDQDGNPYRLYLNRGQQREGSLGLSLVDQNNRRIYATTISFENDHGGSMYIGVIQGPGKRVENRQQVIKSLTKSLHGLRPKALILEFALMLARCMNISQIYGISNQSHIYKSWRYIGRKRGNIVTFDYDTHWKEYGATQKDRNFFSIPCKPERKDLTALNRNKRKLYTKRYQWIDNAEAEFCQNLSKLRIRN